MKCKKNDRASSKMHFKGIIWGGLGEKFEICVRKNKNNRGSAEFIWFLLKKKSTFLLFSTLPRPVGYVRKGRNWSELVGIGWNWSEYMVGNVGCTYGGDLLKHLY